MESKLGVAVPDFVVKRKDGLHAYQLAVVVDDAWQELAISRGLICLTPPRARCSCNNCWATPPSLGHVPVITDSAGQNTASKTTPPRWMTAGLPGQPADRVGLPAPAGTARSAGRHGGNTRLRQSPLAARQYSGSLSIAADMNRP